MSIYIWLVAIHRVHAQIHVPSYSRPSSRFAPCSVLQPVKVAPCCAELTGLHSRMCLELDLLAFSLVGHCVQRNCGLANEYDNIGFSRYFTIGDSADIRESQRTLYLMHRVQR